MRKDMYDVIIVGGGIMGCAAAYYLISGADTLKIAVVERDPTYAQASTTLSMANVRIQFSLKENIRISQYAAEIFEKFDDDMTVPEKPLPLTILPSGLYFRTDTGGQILLGKSMDEDPVGFEFTWDQERFIHHLWPELVTIVPRFDRLKLVRGWAGLYAENTFDGNAILGEWPECRGFYLANGFSGRGFQQAPAVGRYLSELILQRKPSLDLSIFTPQRIFANQPISETWLV